MGGGNSTLEGGANDSRSGRRSTAIGNVLINKDVVVMLVDGCPYVLQRRTAIVTPGMSRSSSFTSTVRTCHMVVAKETDSVSATSPSTHLRVTRKGRWVSFRSAVADNKYMEPNPDRLVRAGSGTLSGLHNSLIHHAHEHVEMRFVHDHITHAEQWSIESARDGEAEFAGVASGGQQVTVPAPIIKLRNRKLRNMVVEVQVVRVPQAHLDARALVMQWAELVLDEVMERNRLERELALVLEEAGEAQARAKHDLVEIRAEASHARATREWLRSVLMVWAEKAEDREARRRQEWGAKAHCERRLLMQCLLQWSAVVETAGGGGSDGGGSTDSSGGGGDGTPTPPASGLTGVLDALRDHVHHAAEHKPGGQWDADKAAAAAEVWNMPLGQFRARLSQAGLLVEGERLLTLERDLKDKGIDVHRVQVTARGGGGGAAEGDGTAGGGLVIGKSVRKMLEWQYGESQASVRASGGGGGSDDDSDEWSSDGQGGAGPSTSNRTSAARGAAPPGGGELKVGDLRVLLEEQGLDASGLAAAVHSLSDMLSMSYAPSTGTFVENESPSGSSSFAGSASEHGKQQQRSLAFAAESGSSLGSSSVGPPQAGARGNGGVAGGGGRAESASSHMSESARSSTASGQLRSVIVRDALEQQFKAAQRGPANGRGGNPLPFGSRELFGSPLDGMSVADFQRELRRRRMDVSGLADAQGQLVAATPSGVDMSKVPASVVAALGAQLGAAREEGAAGISAADVPESVRRVLGAQYAQAKSTSKPLQVPAMVRAALEAQYGEARGGAGGGGGDEEEDEEELDVPRLAVSEFRQRLADLQLDGAAAEVHALEIALTAALAAEHERDSSRGSSMVSLSDSSPAMSPQGSTGSREPSLLNQGTPTSAQKNRERRMRRIRMKRMTGAIGR